MGRYFLGFMLCIAVFTACQQPEQNANSDRVGFNSDANTDLQHWFDQQYTLFIEQQPELMTKLGIRPHETAWNNRSDEQRLQNIKQAEIALKELKAMNTSLLSEEWKTAYDIHCYFLEQTIKELPFLTSDYPANSVEGIQSKLVTYLILAQQIDDKRDAKTYLGRLRNIPKELGILERKLDRRARENRSIPACIFPYIISDCERLSNTDLKQNAIGQDFFEKIDRAELQDSILTAQFSALMQDTVIPGFNVLKSSLEKLKKHAPKSVSLSDQPDGEAYYRYLIQKYTTTDITPLEVFNIGEQEVERLTQEMHAILDSLGRKPNLRAFQAYIEAHPEMYYYRKGDEELMVRDADSIIARAFSKLPAYFEYTPGKIHSVQIEDFRTHGNQTAYYANGFDQGEGDRFCISTSDIENWAKRNLELLAYHEIVPGHHLQISYAITRDGIPEIRKHQALVAYKEGWAHYAEYLADEMGLYTSAESDFGRLNFEMWRAARMVADVGIHFYKWSRKKAIKYLRENSLSTKADCISAVDRIISSPGQVCAYTIGYQEIKYLRNLAERTLGDRFDIKAFHTVILKDGDIPLRILEQKVKKWIQEEKTRSDV